MAKLFFSNIFTVMLVTQSFLNIISICFFWCILKVLVYLFCGVHPIVKPTQL